MSTLVDALAEQLIEYAPEIAELRRNTVVLPAHVNAPVYFLKAAIEMRAQAPILMMIEATAAACEQSLERIEDAK